ncbi:MICAL-like protein 1 isoform X2 [Megalobrama amblycephala]|uniref:MICAL-like protein 1 isoform X2 n=1 Tax=Megalobrama amblycephala TaxID=75352 RepID=UPI0020147BAF|nr:MICAL-like protein 1 isoform X2 [Megalobrama amblycephala]
MCSLKALQDWCRDVCEGYSDVQFTDMSSSFTDGLAFCAIIHKHRPELIDFHSLSKHNVYKNMRLAFDVAERELGISALLDPDELLCEEEPDLLSIITYVSQLYWVFNGKSHDSLKNCVEAEPSSTRTQEQTHTPVYARLSPRKRAGPQEPPSPTPRSQDHRPDNDSLKNCVEAEPSSTRTQEQTHTPVYARLSPRKRAEPQEPPSPTPRSQDHCPDNDSLKNCVEAEPSSTRTQEQTHAPFTSDMIRSSDKRVCSVCHKRVHLIERVLVKGRLYHRACFRCSRCHRALLPISFTVDSETGLLQCSYHCKAAPEHNRPADTAETDGDRSETDGDRSETDGDRSEMERDGVNDERLSTSSDIDIQEPPKPAPRKRVEPQEPPSPTPRSQDHRPDNVPSQSAMRKDHPWMKLVDLGPWYRLPPAPAPSTHSRCCPATFNPFLEDDEDESKDEENRFSCKTSVAHKPQTSCSAPSMHQAAYGFPLIKRKVITDTHVSEKEVCKEQKELEESLLRLEKRGVQLEREMRTRTDDNLLVDWFILIHKKNMLVRRDAELMYMLRQRRLEQQQADVEFELRCLFNKPEQDWSSDDRQQEHQLMSRLLSIIQQRNDIISCLDLDRQREKEEDMMLSAVIQRTDLLTQTDKQLEKFNKKFKGLQMFKASGCKSKNSSRKKSS